MEQTNQAKEMHQTNHVNEIHQTNHTDQRNEEGHTNQEVQTGQMNQVHQAANPMNQMHQTANPMNQMHQAASQMNQMHQVNQTYQIRQMPHADQTNQMHQTESLAASAMPNRNVIRVFSALVEEISRDRGTTFVTISYQNCDGCAVPSDTVRLVVSQDTDIYNEQGQRIRANELSRGMTVDASFSSAMTRSIPPQAQAFFIRVTARAPQTETMTGRIAQVNARGRFIIVMANQNPASAIRFQISPDTVILDFWGRRTNLASLRPGLRVRVEHASFMTASIPPQTTAFVVQMIR
ncbi:MAG: hypothetical protein K2N87_12600 [Eubacterium sp.]|nr:hypothetical protein [Eubacterium sp.]